jgi:hypothetical protein
MGTGPETGKETQKRSETADECSNENIVNLLSQPALLSNLNGSFLANFVAENQSPFTNETGDENWDCDSGHLAVGGDSSVASPGSGGG